LLTRFAAHKPHYTVLLKSMHEPCKNAGAAQPAVGPGAVQHKQARDQRCLRPWPWLVLCETRFLKSAMALAALALKRWAPVR